MNESGHEPVKLFFEVLDADGKLIDVIEAQSEADARGVADLMYAPSVKKVVQVSGSHARITKDGLTHVHEEQVEEIWPQSELIRTNQTFVGPEWYTDSERKIILPTLMVLMVTAGMLAVVFGYIVIVAPWGMLRFDKVLFRMGWIITFILLCALVRGQVHARALVRKEMERERGR